MDSQEKELDVVVSKAINEIDKVNLPEEIKPSKTEIVQTVSAFVYEKEYEAERILDELPNLNEHDLAIEMMKRDLKKTKPFSAQRAILKKAIKLTKMEKK